MIYLKSYVLFVDINLKKNSWKIRKQRRWGYLIPLSKIDYSKDYYYNYYKTNEGCRKDVKLKTLYYMGLKNNLFRKFIKYPLKTKSSDSQSNMTHSEVYLLMIKLKDIYLCRYN